MSYLHQYHKHRPSSSTKEDHHLALSLRSREESLLCPVDSLQIRFTKLRLTTASAQSVINSCSEDLQTLDLSSNRIDSLPARLPPSLLALNLSYNLIHDLTSSLSSPQSSHPLAHLIELNLAHNRFTSTLGLAPLVRLQYLNISYNTITIVQGLEGMKELKVLNLSHNALAALTSLRALSYNVAMEELCLVGNPLLSASPPQLSLSSTAATGTGTAAESVRLQLVTLLPRLQLLDGKPLRLRPLAPPAASASSSSSSVCSPIGAATSTSYSAAFAALTHTSGTATSQPFSSSTTSFSFLPAAVGKEQQGESEKESLDDADQTISGRIRGRRKSALPWRNPPHPLPRPWKGKQLFTTSCEEVDPLRSPINKNYRITTAPRSPSPPRATVNSAPSDGAGLFPTPTPMALAAPPETEIQSMRPEEDAPPQSDSWLCPSLNNSMTLLREAETSWDPTVWQIPREVVLQEEEQERRKRRSASPSARPTRASILRANYVADSLNPPPPPPPAPRRRRSPSPAPLSVRNRLRGDRKSKGDLLVLQAGEEVPVPEEEEVQQAEAVIPPDSLEASDVDVTVARCPQGRLSAYGLLSRLREKIDDRFRAPELAEEDGRAVAVNKHFAYLHSLPIETDPSPALPPRRSSSSSRLYAGGRESGGGHDDNDNDLAAQREMVQEMLRKELSYEAKQLLLSQQLHVQLEQNQMTVGGGLGEADAGGGGGSRTVALDYYEGGESESIATSASAATTRYRYSYSSASPSKAVGGEGSDNAASTDYSVPDSARLFNEMEALRTKQMQSLLSLRAAGVQLRVEEEAPIIPPPPLSPELVTPLYPRPSFTASSVLSPLQALALESVTPTVLSVSHNSTWNISPDQAGGSATSSSPPRERALPTGAVDDGIQQLAVAMEEMKRRQQQSLNMLQSFSIS
eukprot:gene11067-12326_t